MKKEDNKGFSFEDKAWQDMLAKLNAALPIQEKKRRLLPFWWLGIVASFVLGSLVAISYLTLGDAQLPSNSFAVKSQISDIKKESQKKTLDLDQEPELLNITEENKITSKKNLPEKTTSNKIFDSNSTSIISSSNISKIKSPIKNIKRNRLIQASNTPSTLPTTYEIPFLKLTDASKNRSVLNKDYLTSKDQSIIKSQVLKDKIDISTADLDKKINLLPTLSLLKNNNSIIIEKPFIETATKAISYIQPVKSRQQIALSLQTGYLVIGHEHLSDVGYLNINIEKPISEKFGIYASIGMGKESTSLKQFKEFKNADSQVGILVANEYSQIEEKIVGFGNLQAGFYQTMSQKWNYRLGFGYKINFNETATLQNSFSTTKAPQPLETLTFQNQFYGQYDLGYNLNSNFTLLISINMMSSPLSVRNDLVPKSFNTYTGMGLRYQF